MPSDVNQSSCDFLVCVCILLCLGVDKINPDPHSTPPRSPVVCALSSPGPFPQPDPFLRPGRPFPDHLPPAFLPHREREEEESKRRGVLPHTRVRTDREAAWKLQAPFCTPAVVGLNRDTRMVTSHPNPPCPSLSTGLKATTVTCQSTRISIQPSDVSVKAQALACNLVGWFLQKGLRVGR